MKPQEFETLMNFMAAAVNREITDATKEAWYVMLGDLPYTLARAAFMQVLAEHEYSNLPPVGLIRRRAVELRAGKKITAAEAWGMTLRAIKNFGHMREKEALESLPKEAAKIARWLGWRELCHSENVDVSRGQYMKMFETQTRRQQELAIMPPDVRRLVGAVGEALALPGERKGK